jgi:hypothetical protein
VLGRAAMLGGTLAAMAFLTDCTDGPASPRMEADALTTRILAMDVASTTDAASTADLVATTEGVSTDAMVLHYVFDESTGKITTDLSGSGINGELDDGARFAPGEGFFGGAVRLDGIRAYVLPVNGGTLTVAPVGQRTVAAWVRVTDAAIATRKQVVWAEGGTSKGLGIYFYDNRLYVGAFNNTSGRSFATFLSSGAITPGAWHHVAVVLDGGVTIAPDRLRGYLDGVSFGSGAAALVDEHSSPRIGRVNSGLRFHNGNSTELNLFAGLMDDVRVYDRPLDEAEIASLAGGEPPPPPPNRAPLAKAGSDRTVPPGSTLSLDGSTSSDPDNGPAPLSFLWEQIAGDPVTIPSPTNPSISMTIPSAGTYTFRLTVNDGELTGTDEVTVIVANQAPIANAGPDRSSTPNATISLSSAGSSDPDGYPQPLSFLWEQLAGPAVTIVNPTSASASITPTSIGTYDLRLTVSDGELQGSDVISIVVAAADPNVAGVVPGTTLAGTRYGEWEGKNQRRSWWNSYQRRWDAILPATAPPASSESNWWLVTGVEQSAPRYDAQVTSAAHRPDTFWDDAGQTLYVLQGDGGSAFISTYIYDPGTDRYSAIVNKVSVPGVGSGPTMYRTPNGHLWAAGMTRGTGGGLRINRSTNNGATWGTPVTLLMPNAHGQTSFAHFTSGGTTYLALAAAEDGSALNSRYRFLRIDQSSASWGTPSAWTNESGLIPAFQGSEHADDEMSMIADASGNVYIATETEASTSGSGGDPQLILLKRAVTGGWSQVTVTRFNQTTRQRKRPTVGINGATGTLYIFSVGQERTELSYVSAPLTNLGLLSTTAQKAIVQAPGKHFRNNFVPRFPTTAEAGMFVLVDNTDDMTIWRRRLP